MDQITRNIEVFKDTYKLSIEDYSNYTEECKRCEVVYPDPFSIEAKPKRSRQRISFAQWGTVSAVIRSYSKKQRLAVLNFADALTPGGLVQYGEVTQEEDLCCCSNLYPCLLDEKCKAGYYDVNRKIGTSVYTDTLIYSPQVMFFKSDTTYTPVTPVYADVITCPSPSCKVSPAILYHRIVGILKSARLNGASKVILGAWGCGAFGQDAGVVGKCFGKALAKYNFFDEVLFSVKAVNGPSNNYIRLRESVMEEYDNASVRK